MGFLGLPSAITFIKIMKKFVRCECDRSFYEYPKYKKCPLCGRKAKNGKKV